MRLTLGILLIGTTLSAFAKGNINTNSISYVAATGDIARAKQILAADPSLLSSREGSGTLTTAATRGQVEMVKFLVAQGANVNEKGFFDLTPLAYMAWGSHSPLDEKYAQIATILIAHGATVDAVDQYRMTPLEHVVKESENYHLAEALLQGGADPSRTFWGSGSSTTALHYSITHATDDDVAMLLKYHPPLDLEDGDGRTPLQLAELYDKTNIVAMIRELTHDTNTVPSRAEMRALGERIANGDESALRQLMALDVMFRNLCQSEHPRGPYQGSPWTAIHSAHERDVFTVLRDEAAKGNMKAFEMARPHVNENDRRLAEFSLSICSIAAAAGNTEALDVVMHYEPPRGMSYNAYLRAPAAANIGPAVDYFAAWLDHHSALRGGGDILYVTNDLASAARKGNPRAKEALEKFNASAK